MSGDHDVNPKKDWPAYDRKSEWDEEYKERYLRNVMCKTQLQKGWKVEYKSGGNSLSPRVKWNETCLFEPVVDTDKLKVNDIVFCEVQPGNRFFAHLILDIELVNRDFPRTAASARKRRTELRRKFIIGNNKGIINGHCFDEHIYGLLVRVY